MRTSLKISGALLANLAMFSTQVLAYLPEINFDQPTYQPLHIISSTSPDGWQTYGESSITSPGQGYGGGTSQALKIAKHTTEEAWLRKPLVWDPLQKIAFIDFYIKPAATPAGNLPSFYANGTQVAFEVTTGTTTGHVWVQHGNDDNPATPAPPVEWYKTAGTFNVPPGSNESSDWLRVTLRQDYEHKVWDLFVNGNLAAVNLGFDGRGANLEAIEFYGSKAGDTLLDKINADPANMLFPDADKDGLPDAWEIANGSNPNLYDRDAIKPGTGKSFLDHYLDSLWSQQQTPGPVNGSTGVGVVGTVPPLSILADHQPVGSLKGALTVGGDGSASYSLPIDIPKGTGGMEPKLALAYSSNAGNGILGVGWSVSGLQQITRIGSSYRKDGIVDGVDFDNNDRFALDGQRLICTSGNYGDPGSEYRTESDSFSRIKAHAQAGVAGIGYWTVETSSGITATLGDETPVEDLDETTVGDRVPMSRLQKTGGAISWSVNKVRDTVGNYYRIFYARDTEAGFANSVLNQRIASIEYTGYDGPEGAPLKPYATVDFEYEFRADKRTFYTVGIRQTYTQRLAAISVKTKEGNQVHENHRYVMGYKASQQTGRSLLKAVTKVANGFSIPATTFEWRTVDHDEDQWIPAGPVDLPLYADPDWDSRDGLSGMISPVGGSSSHVHLTGVVWRAIPFSFPLTPNTYLEFEYKPSAIPPTYAMIGLDTDLNTGNPPRLVKVIGSGTPPGGGVLVNDLFVPNSGDTPDGYDKKVVHIGGSAATTNWLVLVNDDVTLSNGQGESWFRNIRAYNKDSAGTITDIKSPIFDLENTVPQMINNQGNDLGVRFNDFTGDGRADLVQRIFQNKDGGTGNSIVLDVNGQTMMRTALGYETVPIQVPLNLVSGIKGNATDAPWARRVDLPSVPVDIDADGKVDYCYAKDIFRPGTSSTGHWHGFLTWDRSSGAWQDKPTWALPFRSVNNQNYHRFNHFQFTDLNGDAFPDLVVHLNTGELQDANGVVKSTAGSAWINRIETGQPWLQNDAFALPKPLKIVGVAKGELGRRLFDANADGLPDFVQSRAFETKEVWINTGGGFLKEPQGSKYNLPINLTNSDGDDVGARLIDLNGDGLIDAIKDMSYDGVPYATIAYLNTGDGWHQVADGGGPITPDCWNLGEINFSTFDKYEEENPGKTSAADVNGDGLVDLVIATHNRNTVFFNTGQGWWDSDGPTFWADPDVEVEQEALDLPAKIFRTATAAYNGKAVGLFTDVNGDGVVDFISDTDMPQPKVWINQCRPELIEAVTDGFGARLEVEYTNLNDPAPLSDSNPPLPAYSPHNPGSDEPLSAGQVDVRQGGDVVTRLKESDGAGGFRAKRYHYGDGRFDRINEASLGFGWMQVHDEHFPAGGGYVHQGYKETRSWRQFPLAGRPKVEETYIHVNGTMSHQAGVPLGNRLVARELSAFGELASTTGVGGTIRRIVQTKSVSQKWDLDGSLMAVTLTNQPVGSFDSFGFVTASTISSLDVSKLGSYSAADFLNPATFTNSDDFVLRTVSANSYQHFTGNSWILGRLTSANVTKSRPGEPNLGKHTSYIYYSSGLLKSEEVEPNHLLFSFTEYERDRYGNVTKTKVTANTSGTGSPQTRTTIHGYGSNGRFMESQVVDGLGGEHYHYSFRKALLMGTTDIDNKTTTHTYDVFGTKIADNFPNLTRSAEITRYASNAVLPGSIQTILSAAGISVKWSRTAETSGAPPATVYLDTLGREVVTESVVLTGAAPSFSYQYAIKLFDARGREYLTSNAFLGAASVTNPFSPGTALWTQTFYDVLDRPYKTTSPDGKSVRTASITTERITLNGQANQPVVKVEARNKKDIPLYRWLDVDGKLVRSQDASNQITTFEHDIEGRVRWVGIDGVQQLANGYDIRGNRISVNDRSAGASSSFYNGFGELRWTTNAEGETISTSYDPFGRVSTVTRKDDESPTQTVTFTTTYKPDSPGRGQVWTVTNPKGYLEELKYGPSTNDYAKVIETAKCHKSGAPTYFTYTTYNALGLPITETDAGGLQVVHTYDSYYGSFKIQTELAGPRSALLWKAPSVSWSNGRLVSSEELPHLISRTTETDLSTGRLLQLTTAGLGETLQSTSYTWDENGNLTSRVDSKAGKTEQFGYDSLDRLDWSQVSGSAAVNYDYDANGNIRTKGNGSLDYYDGNTSYRIASAKLKGSTTANRTYQYDLAGRVLADGKRTFSWTGFGQLKSVEQASAPSLETFAATTAYQPRVPGINPSVLYEPSTAVASFEFSAAGTRSKQVLTRTYGDQSRRESVTHYVGSYETEDHATYAANGTYTHDKFLARHQLGSALYTREVLSNGGTTIRLGLVLTDHLGSTDVIVRGDWDATGNRWKVTTHGTDAAQSEPRSERQSFDAWGERRDIGWLNPLHPTDASIRRTSAMDYDRGFTGHEMLDDFALVHMNGRIYDPEIGRFLSPDPYVQVPEYSQNFNRYTYVLNNPLSHTDSSGNEIDGLVAAAIAIVVGIVTYGIGTGFVLSAYGSTALVTANAAGQAVLTWQGMAVVGAFSGAFTGATNAALTDQNVLEGALEGAVSGAIAGGLLHGLGPNGSFLTEGSLSAAREVLHVAGHGILGGIRNEVMGGRFMDGFLSAAAGASSAYMPGLKGVMGSSGNRDPLGMFYRSMIAGAIGGTASAIGGGKFANGAYTAAFQHLVNAELGAVVQRKKALVLVGQKIPARAGKYWVSRFEDTHDVTLRHISDDIQFAAALDEGIVYDKLIYVGHADASSLFVRMTGQGGNILTSPSSIYSGTNYSELNRSAIASNGSIYLVGCRTAAFPRGENATANQNIAMAFSRHFEVGVFAYGGKISFDWISGSPVVKPQYAWGEMMGRSLDARGTRHIFYLNGPMGANPDYKQGN
jgi:RHS repeat-associated protein